MEVADIADETLIVFSDSYSSSILVISKEGDSPLEGTGSLSSIRLFSISQLDNIGNANTDFLSVRLI